ncbi:hypothetical protein ACLOJK_003746 [Asimina triloba]
MSLVGLLLLILVGTAQLDFAVSRAIPLVGSTVDRGATVVEYSRNVSFFGSIKVPKHDDDEDEEDGSTRILEDLASMLSRGPSSEGPGH